MDDSCDERDRVGLMGLVLLKDGDVGGCWLTDFWYCWKSCESSRGRVVSNGFFLADRVSPEVESP